MDLPARVELSVNCSPATLTDPRFHELAAGHPRRRLIVEVTEHAVVDDYPSLERSLARLRDLGARLAIDDAGAGISSLRHIVRLGPDIIKLDISLTQHLQDDPVRRALADCLIQFADRTDSQLVAEGIEDVADLVAWTELGACAARATCWAARGPCRSHPSVTLPSNTATDGRPPGRRQRDSPPEAVSERG